MRGHLQQQRLLACALWGLVVAVSGACDRQPEAPSLSAITPRQGSDDATTVVTLSGTGFAPRVVTDFTRRSGSMLDERFTVRLGDAPLQEVHRVSDQELTAVVPSGLAPGLYAVTVEDPYGREAVLPDAFRVVASGVAAGLAFTTAPVTVEAGACSPMLSLQTVDGLGRPAPVTTAVTLNLTSNLTGTQFFSDASCAAAVSSVTIDAGGLAASFFFRSPRAGVLTVTAISVGLAAGTQDETVLPAAAAMMAFATPPRAVDVGACSAAVTVELRDALGNTAPAPAPLTIAFGAVPIGGVLFFSDPGCTTAASTANLATGASSATVYLQGGAPGQVTVNASTTSFSAISQQATVTTADAGSGGGGGATGGGGGNDDAGAGGGGGSDDAGTGGGGGSDDAGTGGGGGSDDAGTGGGGGSGDAGTGGGGGGTVTPTTPPLARLVVSPSAALPSATLTADATGSTDAEDATGSLQARFDFDSDGTWDTSFASPLTATFSSAVLGIHRVTVEVRDTSGVSSFATASVIIRSAIEAIVVTTAADEADAGATPTSPGGTGLSLREAIAYANGRVGHDVISFSGSMTIMLGSSLPALSDTAGASVIGQPGVILDGTGAGNATALAVQGTGSRVVGLEIRNLGRAGIRVDGANVEVSDCFIHDGGDYAMQLLGADSLIQRVEVSNHTNEGLQINARATILDSQFHHTKVGIAFYANANGSRAMGNRVWANTLRGVSIVTNVTDVVFWHNVVHGNTQSGLWLASNSANCDVRNNIFSNNGSYGVEGAPTFAALDFNDSFGNSLGAYGGATPGANSKTVDPQYRSVAGPDFRLLFTSPLINAGTPTTWDANGPGPGTFNGSAPDLGAFEAP